MFPFKTKAAPPAAQPDEKCSVSDLVREIACNAQQAKHNLAACGEHIIDAVLDDIARLLVERQNDILSANATDVAQAQKAGISSAMIDRLTLNTQRLRAMAAGIETVRALPSPAGRILWSAQRPNGLRIERIAVPFGVLGVIYESRPNVTIDVAALCLKSRNAVILRGGSESFHSSMALHGIIKDALAQNGLSAACVSMIPTPDRAAVGEMLKAEGLIDVVIPRGGPSLVERVMNEARMPVFGHLSGNCHTYIDASADLPQAFDIVWNAKMRRTGVCGATETLLLDRALPASFVEQLLKKLLDQGCNLIGDKFCRAHDPRIQTATEDDWRTEYLDQRMACAVVDGVQGAIAHINLYGSHHTESILAENRETAELFFRDVDSGVIMHNASTQFSDGGEFGMGAEIGIATGKLHARGPVSLEQLCTYKYFVRGTGQIRP